MTRSALRTAFLACALAGCATTPAVDGEEDGFIVPAGKEDDFISLSAAEFVVSGRATVTIEPELFEADEEAQLARVRELITYEQVAIAWFLNQYLVDKHDGDANEDYGGFSAMARLATLCLLLSTTRS